MSDLTGELSAVPLFPLPNVVLFPRAVLPLHIFEHRYKVMTADVLAGKRQVAMALLRPGWEKSYHDRPAIEPVVCVGTILTHEQLADGNYNFLLQGHTRAAILEELKLPESQHRPYRLARLAPLVETAVQEIDFSRQRGGLVSLFTDQGLCPSGLGQQFMQMLQGPMTTAEIADLLAFSFLEDVTLKQSLLAETDVNRRVDRILRELESIRTRAQASSAANLN